MDDRRPDNRTRRRRNTPTTAKVKSKTPLKVISDLPSNLPVTEAEVRLVVAMLGGPGAVRRKLEELGNTQADADSSVVSARHRCKPAS
jgi:hypothetical protein